MGDMLAALSLVFWTFLTIGLWKVNFQKKIRAAYRGATCPQESAVTANILYCLKVLKGNGSKFALMGLI